MNTPQPPTHIWPHSMVSVAELQWLVWKASQTTGNLVEIGTCHGATTAVLAHAFPTRKIWTVDWLVNNRLLPEQALEMPRASSVGRLAMGFNNVIQLLQDSRLLDYSRLGPVGFVFIDGDHSYDGVKADTGLVLDHHRRTGRPMTVVWHDYYDSPWVMVKKYLGCLGPAVGVHLKTVDSTSLAYADLL